VTPFHGKCRGKVENNIDPLLLGRVQVSAPAALGDGTLSWAMPCAPYAGAGVGFWAVPPVGASVWVEFEGGDTDYPIYAGCFWEVAQSPAKPAIPQMKVLKTDGISIQMSDLPGAGGLTIEVSPPVVAAPLMLAFTSSGIELSNGAASIKLTPASVSVNGGALEVI
jgi:hypothetical protein